MWSDAAEWPRYEGTWVPRGMERGINQRCAGASIFSEGVGDGGKAEEEDRNTSLRLGFVLGVLGWRVVSEGFVFFSAENRLVERG